MTRKNATYLLIAYFFFISMVLLMPLGWMGSSLSKIASVSWSDNLVHALLFLPLVPLWKCAFPHHAIGKILIIALLTAITTEGTQYFLPYRSFEVNDLLANFGGVCLGTLFCMVFLKRKPGSFSSPD
jgi:glycopeptide antibiotics resistance protein